MPTYPLTAENVNWRVTRMRRWRMRHGGPEGIRLDSVIRDSRRDLLSYTTAESQQFVVGVKRLFEVSRDAVTGW